MQHSPGGATSHRESTHQLRPRAATHSHAGRPRAAGQPSPYGPHRSSRGSRCATKPRTHPALQPRVRRHRSDGPQLHPALLLARLKCDGGRRDPTAPGRRKGEKMRAGVGGGGTGSIRAPRNTAYSPRSEQYLGDFVCSGAPRRLTAMQRGCGTPNPRTARSSRGCPGADQRRPSGIRGALRSARPLLPPPGPAGCDGAVPGGDAAWGCGVGPFVGSAACGPTALRSYTPTRVSLQPYTSATLHRFFIPASLRFYTATSLHSSIPTALRPYVSAPQHPSIPIHPHVLTSLYPYIPTSIHPYISPHPSDPTLL